MAALFAQKLHARRTREQQARFQTPPHPEIQRREAYRYDPDPQHLSPEDPLCLYRERTQG